MPALRSFPAEILRNLYHVIAPSVVQLSVFDIDHWFAKKEGDAAPSQFGTGIVLSCAPDRIGIVTTVNCEPPCKVEARFGDQIKLEAKVVMKSGLLFGLVVRGVDLPAVPCTPAKFYEGPLVPSGPTFVVGCQGLTNHLIIVSGLTSVEEFEHVVGGIDVFTFVHTSPIGDGLIGALVLDQFGRILGINVARTHRTAKINYALKNEELIKMLAGLVGEEVNPETDMAKLLEQFGQKILKSELPMPSLLVKRKRATINSSARFKRRQ